MFQLPPLLERECFFVKNFLLSQVLLKNDARFLWLILVPKRANIQEIYELTQQDQALLGKEIRILSPFVKSTFKADKLNIASIGNIVPTLHIHLVGRRKGDPLWPFPVWGDQNAIPYTSFEKEALITNLQRAF